MTGETWPTVPLADLCDPIRGITYGIVKVGDFIPGGVPVIRGGDIRGGCIECDDSKRVTEAVSNQFARTILRGGEIVLNLISDPGHSAVVPPDLAGHNVSRDVAVIPLKVGADVRFIDFFLRSNVAIHWLTARLQGSVTQKINLGTLRELPVSLPPLPEQRAITHILGTLDDKIELNRKTNETLVAMARALFKSWFVDFDPVRAKSEGRPTGLPDEISDLFTDSFEDSELGEIPRGWRISSLDEIADNRRETVRPGDMDSSDRYIGLEHMPRGSICLGESGDAADLESSKSRFSEGDVLYGKLRPYFKKTGYAQFDGVCSTDIVVARKKSKNGTGFICCLLASDSFIDFTVSASTGTRMPRTNWKDMCEFSFAIPTPLLLNEFDNQFCRLIERIKTSCSHSRHLASTRDTLLPKLISGELRIPDAERLLEEAGV